MTTKNKPYFACIIQNRIDMMLKSVSRWAHGHPSPARVLIVLMQAFILLMGVVTGLVFAGMWGEIPGYFMWACTCLFLLTVLFYPLKLRGQGATSKMYIRSRLMDAMLVFASFCMIVTATNRDEIHDIRSGPAYQIVPVVHHEGSPSTTAERKITRKEFRKQMRKSVRRVASGLKLWEAILLSVLLGAALIAAAFFVVALSCSAACSGLDGLAVLIILAGGGLLAWLGILGYRAIWKEKKKRRKR